MRVAIIGAGNIANQMAQALNGLDESVIPYAVASRNMEKAEKFAKKWNFEKAYGSYEELVEDPEVDLVYIATPHALHYEHAMLCLKHNKPILVEKAFTGKASWAKEVLEYSQEHHIFATEAIWTRYLPSRRIVENILQEGIIGEPVTLEAEFSLPIAKNERMHEPALAGGALLDLGMYTLTFASMFFGNDVERWESRSKLYKTGVDADDRITMYYADGKKATLRTSMVSLPKNYGKIIGTKGSIEVKELNNFSKIAVYDERHKLVKDYPIPAQINGYEYEVLACKRALEAGEIQCKEMPHEETILLMEWMDALRTEWGVRYPFDEV